MDLPVQYSMDLFNPKVWRNFKWHLNAGSGNARPLVGHGGLVRTCRYSEWTPFCEKKPAVVTNTSKNTISLLCVLCAWNLQGACVLYSVIEDAILTTWSVFICIPIKITSGSIHGEFSNLVHEYSGYNELYCIPVCTSAMYQFSYDLAPSRKLFCSWWVHTFSIRESKKPDLYNNNYQLCAHVPTVVFCFLNWCAILQYCFDMVLSLRCILPPPCS